MVNIKFISIFSGIIFVIVAVTVLGSLIGTVDTEASKSTPEGICTHISNCYWNDTGSSGSECQIETGNTTACPSGQPTAYAGNGIMATGGIITLVVLLGSLIVVVYSLKFKK